MTMTLQEQKQQNNFKNSVTQASQMHSCSTLPHSGTEHTFRPASPEQQQQ